MPPRMLALVQGTTIPSSRFRVGQLVPGWQRLGLQIDVRPGYGDRYNDLAATPLGPPYKLASRLRRVLATLDAGRYDLVFVQRPALPQTWLPEQLLVALNPRMIFDYDDHIGMGPGGPSAARQETLERCVSLSARSVAGNTFLARLGGRPSRTVVIPTVIDADRYVPAPRQTCAEVVLGWMGTASNFGALRAILPQLRRVLAQAPGAKLRVVSNGQLEELVGHPQVEQLRWSKEHEIAQLQRFDIGLMPLEDTLANQGKCGFKMIQYMSVGAPVVVSAVGANVDIFKGAEAGYCLSEDRWEEALMSLIDSPARRREHGQAGRAHVERHYSIASVEARYGALFEEVLAQGR